MASFDRALFRVAPRSCSRQARRIFCQKPAPNAGSVRRPGTRQSIFSLRPIKCINSTHLADILFEIARAGCDYAPGIGVGILPMLCRIPHLQPVTLRYATELGLDGRLAVRDHVLRGGTIGIDGRRFPATVSHYLVYRRTLRKRHWQFDAQ